MLKTAEGKRIKIISTVAPRWKALGDLMEFDEFGSKLDTIKTRISAIQKNVVVKCFNSG